MGPIAVEKPNHNIRPWRSGCRGGWHLVPCAWGQPVVTPVLGRCREPARGRIPLGSVVFVLFYFCCGFIVRVCVCAFAFSLSLPFPLSPTLRPPHDVCLELFCPNLTQAVEEKMCPDRSRIRMWHYVVRACAVTVRRWSL